MWFLFFRFFSFCEEQVVVLSGSIEAYWREREKDA
jgi:hypothetical protein